MVRLIKPPTVTSGMIWLGSPAGYKSDAVVNFAIRYNEYAIPKWGECWRSYTWCYAEGTFAIWHGSKDIILAVGGVILGKVFG